MATDLDTWLIAEIPAEGDDFAFVFSKPKDAVKACRYFEGELSLELNPAGERSTEDWTVSLTCGYRTAGFAVSSAEDYPQIPEPAARAHTFSVNAEKLYSRIERVRYAALVPAVHGKESLAGIQFRGNDIFALDGYRMACDSDPALEVPVPFLVPAAPLSYLKLFGAREISVSVSGSRVHVADGSFHLHMRRINGETYDPTDAHPGVYRDALYVSPKELLRELIYLQGLVPKNSRAVVRFYDGELSLVSSSHKCSTAVKAEGRSEIALGFEPRYVIEALRQFEREPKVAIRISGALSPFVIQAERRTDYALVLPVRMRACAAA